MGEPGSPSLERFERWLREGAHEQPPAPRGIAAARARLPAGTRARARRLATAVLRPLVRGRAARAQARGPLRLHLGCGHLYKQGWVNIDLAGVRTDLSWDLLRGIPFADASARGVFCEHLLEHLTVAQGLELLRECHRVLEPGGVLRIGVPDARALLEAYFGRGERKWVDLYPTPMLAVGGMAYEHGHRSMYDAETLDLLCCAAGFPGAQPCEFGQGRLEPNVDSEERRGWTLYVEAIKPPAYSAPARSR